MELKVLCSRLGVSLLGAAVFDDILVLLGLSIFLALAQPTSGSGWVPVLRIVLKMMLFLGGASLLGWWAFPKLSQRVSKLPISQGLISLAFVVLLLYGWGAEILGQMAAITGAFFAGLWFGRTAEKDRIHSGISTIAYAIFVPIFFVNIGLSVNARALTGESIWLFLVISVVAVISKVIGAGYGARLGGLTQRESLQLGVGMVSRGEVGLIVETIGIEQGLIQESIFSAVLGMVIFTTLVTPPLLRSLFSKKQSALEKTSPTPEGDEA
jgi:Kef-type K+ transport system membrane component KefB